MSKESTSRVRFWKKHITAMSDSGLNQRDYSRKHGLNETTLSKWRQRLSSKTSARRSRRQLVPVEVVDTPPKALGASFRLMLPSLGTVEISGDAGAVARLIQMLRWEVV